ncbi:hypothetical protein RND81_07G040600 [Saponaria officinalis]|uniref:Uncharacterized protein n=1 Tax=Saponaria officinalis TaxID=3572 RepID=A0AAW1JNN3_SAPOF
MAVDVYSEHFISINSPSFSFTNDLQQNETTTNPTIGYNPCRFDPSFADSSFDFDFAFNVDTSTSFPSSTADELFSNGKILPISAKKQVIKQVKHEIMSIPCLNHQSNRPFSESTKKSLKEFLEDSSEDEEPNTVVITKPFWKFRRSNSVNCDTNQKKGLIGSWKILSRSGSTGKFLEKIMEENEEKKSGFFRKYSRNNSVSSNQNDAHRIVGNNKGVNISSEILRRSNSTSDNYFAKSDMKSFRRSKSTGSALNHGRNKKFQQEEQFLGNAKVKSEQKGQIKNGKASEFGGYYSKSVKINPVLNLPSPYISRVSVDLFGIGSLFCNGSVKDRKKRNYL